MLLQRPTVYCFYAMTQTPGIASDNVIIRGVYVAQARTSVIAFLQSSVFYAQRYTAAGSNVVIMLAQPTLMQSVFTQWQVHYTAAVTVLCSSAHTEF